MTQTFNDIFRKSSKTYFYSSILFPKEIQHKVSRLYAFVRVADDYVDSIPQNLLAYSLFKQCYFGEVAEAASEQDTQIIKSFKALEFEVNFDPAWTKAFFDSMDMDLGLKIYKTISDTEDYIYGSAAVIGLFMAQILDLKTESYFAAENLGKAFQYINFIRDIAEDITLNRNYFPTQEMQKFGLDTLDESEVKIKASEFEDFINSQLQYYYKWQTLAESGFKFIPKRYRIAVQTASDMYKWTAKAIEKDPFIVFKKKVKPTKSQVLLTGIRNILG